MNQHNFKIKINTYFKTMSKKRIPKFLSLFFLTLFFGLGFDFGFINVINIKYRCYLKQLSFIVSFLLLTHLFTPMLYGIDYLTLGLYGTGCFQYTVHCLLLYTSKYNLYQFITDIYKIHTNIYDKEYIFLSCILAYSLMSWGLKLIMNYFLCTLPFFDCFTISSAIPEFTYYAPVMALDVVSVAQILTYYYVHAALKFLRELMEKKYIDLISARKQFIIIADCCDKISALYGKLVSAGRGDFAL